MKTQVPKALRTWFIIHFIIDIIFAMPLFFFPIYFLELLNWQSIDPVTTRIIAAALFAIGTKSFLERNASIEVYKSMLTLKLIWSFFAAISLAHSTIIGEFNNPALGWLLFSTFFLFHLLWWFWKNKINHS